MGKIWRRCWRGWKPVEQASCCNPFSSLLVWAAFIANEWNCLPGHGGKQPGWDCGPDLGHHDKQWVSSSWQKRSGKNCSLWREVFQQVPTFPGESCYVEEAQASVWRNQKTIWREWIRLKHVQASNHSVSCWYWKKPFIHQKWVTFHNVNQMFYSWLLSLIIVSVSIKLEWKSLENGISDISAQENVENIGLGMQSMYWLNSNSSL